MTTDKSKQKSVNSFQSWIISLSILFFSFSSTVLALVCIFALPDRSVRPLQGGVFFLGGAIVLIALLLFRWKKDMEIFPNNQIAIRENLSDKILKWVTTFFCFGFASWGFAIALICIYALPDKTFQPKTGIIYFLGSAIVVASFIFVVWKNWLIKKR